jgi:hypothetical protein
MITDDPALKAMREINPAFVSVTRHFGTPVAGREPCSGVWRGSEMATLGEIAANAAPVAHMWGVLAAAQDHELGHA